MVTSKLSASKIQSWKVIEVGAWTVKASVKNSKRGSRLNNNCSDAVRDVGRRREVSTRGPDEREKFRKDAEWAFHFRCEKWSTQRTAKLPLLLEIIKEVVNVTGPAFSSILGRSDRGSISYETDRNSFINEVEGGKLLLRLRVYITYSRCSGSEQKFPPALLTRSVLSAAVS